jgi:adenosylcobinamide-GDP ribazoletransferase
VTAGSGLRSAVGFLTVVPASAPLTPSAVPWFAVVGAAAGAVLGVAWWGAGELLDPLTAAAVVVALDAALTGGLHYDGLLDSADGLLPHMARERRLEVMREPTVGSFAVVTAVVVVILRWSALAVIEPSVLLLACLLAASRAVAAVALSTLPAARPGGVAAAFTAGRTGTVAAVVALAAACVAAAFTAGGAVAVPAAALAAAAVVVLSLRRLGGITGDVLGAAILVAETAALVVAAGFA